MDRELLKSIACEYFLPKALEMLDVRERPFCTVGKLDNPGMFFYVRLGSRKTPVIMIDEGFLRRATAPEAMQVILHEVGEMKHHKWNYLLPGLSHFLAMREERRHFKDFSSFLRKRAVRGYPDERMTYEEVLMELMRDL
jgi:tRNA isopentenyl-2-thiomethyl-A-37 hydroxylase MiaE